MKMVILIVKNQDADEITQALTSEKYRITRVASTGGFSAERRCHVPDRHARRTGGTGARYHSQEVNAPAKRRKTSDTVCRPGGAI